MHLFWLLSLIISLSQEDKDFKLTENVSPNSWYSKELKDPCENDCYKFVCHNSDSFNCQFYTMTVDAMKKLKKTEIVSYMDKISEAAGIEKKICIRVEEASYYIVALNYDMKNISTVTIEYRCELQKHSVLAIVIIVSLVCCTVTLCCGFIGILVYMVSSKCSCVKGGLKKVKKEDIKPSDIEADESLYFFEKQNEEYLT